MTMLMKTTQSRCEHRDCERFLVPAGPGGNCPGCGSPLSSKRKVRVSALAALSVPLLLGLLVVFLPPRKEQPAPGIPPQSPPPNQPTRRLADRLLSMVDPGQEVQLELEPSLGIGPQRLNVGSPVRFFVESRREGYLLLFTLSPDGSITCLYPNKEREVVTLAAGRPLLLPSAAEREAGFELMAQEPLGRELTFAVVSARSLPSLPPSNSGTLSNYLAGEQARTFTDWLEGFLKQNSGEARMAALEIEIGAAR